MERVQTHHADSDRSSCRRQLSRYFTACRADLTWRSAHGGLAEKAGRWAAVEKAPIERPELASIGDTAEYGGRLRAGRCGSPLKREIRIEDRTVAQHCDVVAVVHRHQPRLVDAPTRHSR